MECYKTMKNKMVTNIYLSTIEYKKQTKRTRTEIEVWNAERVLMIARWEGFLG